MPTSPSVTDSDLEALGHEVDERSRSFAQRTGQLLPLDGHYFLLLLEALVGSPERLRKIKHAHFVWALAQIDEAETALRQAILTNGAANR